MTQSGWCLLYKWAMLPSSIPGCGMHAGLGALPLDQGSSARLPSVHDLLGQHLCGPHVAPLGGVPDLLLSQLPFPLYVPYLALQRPLLRADVRLPFPDQLLRSRAALTPGPSCPAGSSCCAIGAAWGSNQCTCRPGSDIATHLGIRLWSEVVQEGCFLRKHAVLGPPKLGPITPATRPSCGS